MKSLPRLSVENPVLVNLLMFGIIGAGVYCGMTLVRAMFPESRPNAVLIVTPYPGAAPAEVEKGISIKIEEQIKDIEGIEEITTSITEGLSTIRATLYNDFDDIDRVVNDIKNAVDGIPRDDFPEEAEETIVQRFEPTLPVISVSWFGDMTDEQLKTMGKRLRDDILALPDVTDVVLSGTRRDEIDVEVQPDQLIRYGLSFMDIADVIRRGNMDLPGGQVKTAGANLAVRTLGEKDQAEEIAQLVVRADAAGQIVRLADVAKVVDGFEDIDLRSRIDGQPGITVTISKTEDQDAILIAERVKALVAGKNHAPFDSHWINRLTGREKELRNIYERAYETPYPSIGTLKTHSNLARFIEGRLDLLQRNGLWGLFFVFVSLLIFLNWRVAFWVMMGLVLAICGTLVAMQVVGVTLNLISMFGLIVVLGMLVDDAIIVGEHICTKIEAGVEPELAAIRGTEEVTLPVACAIATTIAAFMPLLFVKGQIGDFMGVLPVIVICALTVSLFEALTILPSHLAESFTRAERRRLRQRVQPRASRWRTWRSRMRAVQQTLLVNVLRRGYRNFLTAAVHYRYVTVATALAVLILSVGLVAGGVVERVFIQNMDSETVVANLELPVGSPMSKTSAIMSRLEDMTDDFPEMRTRFSLVGAQMNIAGDGTASSMAHTGQLIIELLPSEERDRSSDDIMEVLRERSANIAGVNSLTFQAIHGGPGGAAVQIEISGESIEDLLAVTARVKERLRDFAGVNDIEDDFEAGQREVQIELLDSGRALGLTTESLATQVRAAFYGLEARKIQRDREDVRIMVRYPVTHRRHLADLEDMRVATPGGALVPITEVARINERTGYAAIHRKNQKRTVIVRADVDQNRANSQEVLAALKPDFATLRRDYPGVDFALGGRAKEFRKSFGSLNRDMLFAIGFVFVILAGLFKSYIQPLIVMTAIPFGLIGAVVGHWIMGYPITILSMIGLVALTGIVVNDSLILVDFINRRVAEGVEVEQAVVEGGQARLRAILLTSITTILGLAPLLMEKSFQARFLIPMGISIAFGLAFSTALTLVVVPCLYVILDDVRWVARRIWRVLWPTTSPPTTATPS